MRRPSLIYEVTNIPIITSYNSGSVVSNLLTNLFDIRKGFQYILERRDVGESREFQNIGRKRKRLRRYIRWRMSRMIA